MKLGTNVDVKTGKVNYGYLTFESGKKVILDAEEVKEVQQKLRIAKEEGKLGRDIVTRGLTFTCPYCGSHRLECCEDGPYSSEILNIDEDGDFDYGEIDASGVVDRFQCLNCGFALTREDGSNIDENEEVIEWIKNNCKEK